MNKKETFYWHKWIHVIKCTSQTNTRMTNTSRTLVKFMSVSLDLESQLFLKVNILPHRMQQEGVAPKDAHQITLTRYEHPIHTNITLYFFQFFGTFFFIHANKAPISWIYPDRDWTPEHKQQCITIQSMCRCISHHVFNVTVDRSPFLLREWQRESVLLKKTVCVQIVVLQIQRGTH